MDFPDEEGIKTFTTNLNLRVDGVRWTSLMKKGLRRMLVLAYDIKMVRWTSLMKKGLRQFYFTYQSILLMLDGLP